jgi:upstream activation factor subunit UAF30
MPRSKPTKESVVVEPVSVVDVANVVEPVKVKKSKKTKTVVSEVVPEVTNEVTVDVSLPPLEENVVDVELDQSIEFNSKLQQLSLMISTLKSEFKTLEKKWSRDLKNAQKISSKRKRKSGNRAPSGFVKPTRISDELALFLDKPSGSEMARTEVTRDINSYIRKHNLQDKENGRKIIPDEKLASLLKITDKDVLTYFNLQRYMSPHFAKAVKPVVESV